jgi:hypothetical protein
MDRDSKQRGRQQQTVGRHHEDVGTRDSHSLDAVGRDFLGLVYLGAERGRVALNRTRLGPQAATRRAIGLRQDERELVAGVNQARQGRRCKFRRAGED